MKFPRYLPMLLAATALAGSAYGQTTSTGTTGGSTATTGSASAATGKIKPGLKGPLVGRGTLVLELNGSDCRLDGGIVIIPGDDRCGKLGAPYCRKPNGEAACLTEQ